ncbi:ceramidase, partial [Coemansia spiralis]
MIIEDTVRDPSTYFWGRRTSTIDWCEENYAVTNFIAEFWNTLTNVTMVTMALLGVYSSIKHNQDKRAATFYIAMLLVGCGSACFHATLKYTTQLLDELPMLYLCTLAFYSLVEIERKTRYGWKLPAALAAFQVLVTAIYIFWLQNPVFHQIVFAVTACGAAKLGHSRINDKRVSNEARRMLVRLFVLGHICMLSGFFIWNLDNIFCHQLRSYRSYVGVPLDALLQLHGWWHILTAYG